MYYLAQAKADSGFFMAGVQSYAWIAFPLGVQTIFILTHNGQLVNALKGQSASMEMNWVELTLS
jgi:hypothetical protein